jgi:GTP cyclohydrolase I
MTARGIKSRNAVTRTSALNGRFLTDASLRNEVYQLCKIDK